jgi:hypothetical protein
VHADASRDSTRDYDQIAAEILAEADAVDRAEDEQFGDARASTETGWSPVYRAGTSVSPRSAHELSAAICRIQSKAEH